MLYFYANSKSRRLCARYSVVGASLSLIMAAAGCNSSSDATGAGTTSGVCSSASGSHLVTQNSPTPWASAGTPSATRMLSGHLLPAVARAADQGKVDDAQELGVTVSLGLQHADELAQELADIYNPTSVNFHHFMQPAEFRAKYGPTAEQVAQVQNYLAGQGLHSMSVDANGLLVKATGSAGNLATAFGTELHQYRDAQGRSFRAPNQELQIPSELAIEGVHGLQNLMVSHTHSHPLAHSDAVSRAATGPNGGFSPTDIRSAYNVPSNPDASGQTLAVFELDGYTASDVTGYESKFGLPAVPLTNVLVGSATGSAGSGAAEVTLDIELMIALAPNVSSILVYEGVNDDQGMLATYSKIASDNLAKSISTSWGAAEGGMTSSFLQSENTVFMQMAAQGQTIYSAAGDSGADDNGTSLSVDDPSSQPYVVGVGGTSLTTTSAGARQAETTWNDSSGGGGGGISTVWTVPSWQQGLATTANKASSTMRNVPDVALNADITTGYAIYYQGAWSVWGGTSCAAPLWAAFTALVNHQRVANGLSTLGYANPVLYGIARTGRYATDFFDIADGSTNGYYPATTGYDAATGLGTLNAAGLLGDLAEDGPNGVAATSCGG